MNHLSDTINVGVADIFFEPQESSVPVYLGITIEGAVVKLEGQWKELTSDQTGQTPLDDVHLGDKITAEFKLLDTTKYKMAIVLPTAKPEGTKENPTAVTFGRRPGLRATHNCGKLRIHPVSMGGDTSNDVIIYRSANIGGLELSYKLDAEWVIPCTFKGYFDDLRPEGDQLFRIGDDVEIDGGGSGNVVLFWITPSNPTVKTNATITFKANAMYESGQTEDVTSKCTWTSSKTDICALSGQNTSTITATGVLAGTSTIRAEFIGYSNITNVKVEE